MSGKGKDDASGSGDGGGGGPRMTPGAIIMYGDIGGGAGAPRTEPSGYGLGGGGIKPAPIGA